MNASRRLLLAALCVCAVSVARAQSWNGNVCSRTICTYKTKRVCAYSTWLGCCEYKTIRVPAYVQQERCCRGWTETSPGNRNCSQAICNPPCQNGGTCIRPNKCECPKQNPGRRCGGVTCSHLTPCFPGMCLEDDGCDCSSGFSSATPLVKQNYCLRIEDNSDVRIYQMRVRMANYERDMDMYDIVLDSSNSSTSDSFWTNRKDFNRLEANCSSQYLVPDVPPEPDYIQNYGFGIVEAKVQVWLQKLPPAGQTDRPSPSLNKTISCNRVVNDTLPEEDIFQCEVIDQNFDRLIEHGDFLKITYVTGGGGFRDVVNENTGTRHSLQTYTQVTRDLSVEFRFDFRAPSHCGENSSCTGDETMLSVPDITRTPDITIKWKGWTDADSKMYRYSMEVFQMTRATNGELEIHPDRDLDPLINRPVLHDGNRLYAEQYTLPSPGMYSIILEVADRANNTKYVRRLCLYDPNPEITLDPDPDHDLFVSSANPDSGYAYQNKRKDPVVVTWDQHFKNVFQVENNLLGRVRAYGPELENNVKQIPQDTELEDHEGDRTIDAIPNIDGIANFQVAYVKDHSGGSDQPEPPSSSQWTDLYLNTTYIVPVPDKELVAADTVTIWVKATDATGIEKVARTKVSFDFTPPELNQEDLASGFRMNTAVEGMDFSSTFNLQVFDWESGIDFIQWTFTRRNGDVVYKTKEPGKTVQTCPDTFKCRCIPGGSCYSFDQSFSLSNCHIMVEKENLRDEVITVTANVTNMAGLVLPLTMEKDNLHMLNGSGQYYPPQNIQVKSRTKDSVTITWDYPPSCFERTGFWVIVNGQRHAVHMDAREYVISGLEPGQSYTIYMVTGFIGGEQSDQQAIVCATEDDDGLGDFAIAGITIGLLILLALIVLIVVFVLYRRRVILQEPGPVNKQLSRMSHAFDNARRFTMKRSNPEGGFFASSSFRQNNAYMLGEDAVYPDGHMALNTHRNWQLADSDLTFQDHVAEGKSAKIYKATWRHDGLSDIVAAKMLKPGFSKEDAQKMMAKINFFATAFGNHDNVIRFLGAVTNNTSRGPVLVMEYCECGQMDEWLASRRNNVDEQTMQNMFRFSLGVAKGMEYLASKGITHGRLAARNVLLTFVLDAKVAGFGPQHKEGAEHNMTGVPVKWAAPEVLEDEPPTEKSDVWSFGVVLWEIFSMGQVPYPSIHADEIGSRLKGGYRMQKPDFANDVHYDLMKECWHHNQSQRPTFKTVRARLENFSPDKRQSVDSYYETHKLQ